MCSTEYDLKEMGKMHLKSFRLLIFLLIALGFIGLAGTVDAQLPLIDNIMIEAHDADNQPENPYGIRLVTITVDGKLDTSDDEVLGTILTVVDENGNGAPDPGEKSIKVTQGYLWAGGHELRVTGGTHIVSQGGVDDMIETNPTGGFIFAFALPADIVENQDVTLILTFGNEEGDLSPQIYAHALFIPAPEERPYNFADQIPQERRHDRSSTRV